jgi:hypothetical protein
VLNQRLPDNGNEATKALPAPAGGFIYITGSDLLPELHRESDPTKSVIQMIAMAAGDALMLTLAILELGVARPAKKQSVFKPAPVAPATIHCAFHPACAESAFSVHPSPLHTRPLRSLPQGSPNAA